MIANAAGASALKCFAFSPPTEDDPNLPFPKRISADGFVLYHGTSSANESAIESNGLSPANSLFTLAELQAVVDVFKSIGWYGSTAASLAVLEPFSIQHDFAFSDGKRLYLAESTHRACLYASMDFAGGETARSVRYSLDELWSYLRGPSVREAHYSDVQREIENCRWHGSIPPPLPNPDLEKLRAELEGLSEVYERAKYPHHQFTHGVVYAIKFEPDQLASLVAHNSMGVMCSSPIPKSMIVAKTDVPADFQRNSCLPIDYLALPAVRSIVEQLRTSRNMT